MTVSSGPSVSSSLTIPSPATGMRRRWNQGVLAVMHLLPRPIRRRLGWWRWDELTDGTKYDNAIWVDGQNNPHRLPAAKLWRRGLVPSARTSADALWPVAFRSLAKRKGPDQEWHRVPDSELVAWVGMWRAHPQGRRCLNRALLGLVDHGEKDRVQLLLSAGAGKKEETDLPKALFESLWGRATRPLKDTLDLWGVIREADIPMQSWEEWAQAAPGRMTQRWTAKDMECWRQSGLPMPTGQVALRHALSWVNDPPIAMAFRDSSLRNGWPSQDKDDEVEVAVQAVRWFKEHGNLPPGAFTALLAKWLSTARPGNNEHHAVGLWLEELLREGLPPRPSVGPRWRAMSNDPDDGPQPWSHWWARCPFFECIPQHYVEKLFAEPDAWSAINKDGEDIRDIARRRIKDARQQSGDRKMEAVESWVLASAMDREIPDVPLPFEGPARRPKSRL